MWFKSSFTIPAVVAISFCFWGATPPIRGNQLPSAIFDPVGQGTVMFGGGDWSRSDTFNDTSESLLTGQGCCPGDLTEGFEDPDTIFSYSSTHSIPYDIQNSEAAHAGKYSFKSYTSTCPASCFEEYRVDLLHTFSEPVRLIGVELWAREGSTTGSAWGGKIAVGHDATWNLWWWGVVNNGDPITGKWQYMYVPIDEMATNVRIWIMDITSVSTMWLDDIVIHYVQPCPPCPWDLDCNGSVGVEDLLFLLGVWGPCPPQGDCTADFDNSGAVDVKDLLFLLGAWGPCP